MTLELVSPEVKKLVIARTSDMASFATGKGDLPIGASSRTFRAHTHTQGLDVAVCIWQAQQPHEFQHPKKIKAGEAEQELGQVLRYAVAKLLRPQACPPLWILANMFSQSSNETRQGILCLWAPAWQLRHQQESSLPARRASLMCPRTCSRLGSEMRVVAFLWQSFCTTSVDKP